MWVLCKPIILVIVIEFITLSVNILPEYPQWSFILLSFIAKENISLISESNGRYYLDIFWN